MLLVRESVLASLLERLMHCVVLFWVAWPMAFLLAQIRHCYVKRCMTLPCVAVIVFLRGVS
jgi:hypothetical protein